VRSIAPCRSGVARVGVALIVTMLGLGCDNSSGAGVGSGGRAGNGTGGAMNVGGAGGVGNSVGGAGGSSAQCPAGPGSVLGIAMHPDEGANHIVACSNTSYRTVPPSSGPHYQRWPAYKTYAQPVPWGYLMHGLEHGAVVVVYNCPGGCLTEVAAAQAWINALPPADPLCPGEPPRVILAPDPTLDVRWAASAWGWTLRACAFDATMFQAFFDDHYNRSIESICRSSSDLDLAATGWCP
jgi:hypothetical protein